jgi:hypothetical protein
MLLPLLKRNSACGCIALKASEQWRGYDVTATEITVKADGVAFRSLDAVCVRVERDIKYA